MESNKIISKVDELLKSEGLNIQDFIAIYATQAPSRLNELFRLNEEDHLHFVEIYDNICKTKKFNTTTTEKGKLLEDLTYILFHGSKKTLLTARKNCRTTTNEIDLLLEWNKFARQLNINNIYPCFGDSFICECKNYQGPVAVTYVGKFFSLLTATQTTFGVMVAWDGISGPGEWNAAKGLTKKIALSTQKYIISIDKNDLKKIYDNQDNIFNIIYNKYTALKNDINYEKDIEPHEAENEMMQ